MYWNLYDVICLLYLESFLKHLYDMSGFESCSEEEARMKIYSVSTRCYFAFGALVSEDLSHKLKGNIFPFLLLSLSVFHVI